MRIADAIERNIRVEDIQFRAYDGSQTGPDDAPITVEIRSPRALSYLATAPGELGLARAYVNGDLEVEGDIYTALRRLVNSEHEELRFWRKLRLLRSLGGLRLLRRPPIPPQEARLRGRLHSRQRDQEAISHHYDVSNAFYERLLGPSMTYTCAVFRQPNSSLTDAQWAKHELIAGKLALKPGMRLLDVGCGWGEMVMHAARHHGVRALGVTLSKRQAEWAQQAIEKAGLSALAEVRHLDYRDISEDGFDAISSIGLTEHIGATELASYFRFLLHKLRPGARLLNHCITRPNNQMEAEPGHFFGRYVFPDGGLVGVGRLASLMQDIGFEIRHAENLREHYAKTLTEWSENLAKNWYEAIDEIGLERARVWRLYLAASRLGFEQNDIQLHQILAVKNAADGDAMMSLRPNWEPKNGPDGDRKTSNFTFY